MDEKEVQSIVLPTCHGKTTFHESMPGVVDAGELVTSKIELRGLRRQARLSGNWECLDKYWIKEITLNIPETCVVLLVPSVHLARKLPYKVAGSYVLSLKEFVPLVTRRGSPDLVTALQDRETELLENPSSKLVESMFDLAWEISSHSVRLRGNRECN